MTDNRAELLLKMEISNKEDEIKRLKQDKYNLAKALNQSEDYRAIARNEAIREFAERLHKKADVYDDDDTWFYFIDPDEIDNLVKEMVGENNG